MLQCPVGLNKCVSPLVEVVAVVLFRPMEAIALVAAVVIAL